MIIYHSTNKLHIVLPLVSSHHHGPNVGYKTTKWIRSEPDVEDYKPDVEEDYKPDVEEDYKPDVEEEYKPDVEEDKPDVEEDKPDVEEDMNNAAAVAELTLTGLSLTTTNAIRTRCKYDT